MFLVGEEISRSFVSNIIISSDFVTEALSITGGLLIGRYRKMDQYCHDPVFTYWPLVILKSKVAYISTKHLVD